MSVDLSILVRNDFSRPEDPKACSDYVISVIEGLKRHFLSEDIVDDLRLDDYGDFSFYLKPLGNVKVHLHKGCWELETAYHYSQYFYKDQENSNFIRRLAFDLARAFGKYEAWITNEYMGWAGVLETVSDSYEDWVNSKGYGDDDDEYYRIIEYNPDDFPNINTWNEESSCKYHDSFDEPKKRLAQLSALFPDFQILTIAGYGNIILAKKEDRLYALDLIKEKLVVDFPLDGVNDNYNSVALEIFKNGKSALFNCEGEQLSPFGNYDFQWHWGKGDNSIEVTDDISGQKWIFPLE